MGLIKIFYKKTLQVGDGTPTRGVKKNVAD